MFKKIFQKYSQYNSLQTQVSGNLMRIYLNEPKTKNALSINMIDELNTIIDDLPNNKNLKILSIQSSQQGHFCTGANLKERIQMNENQIEEFVCRLRQTFQKIYKLDILTFALINGYCLGGGLELALSCDFRLSTKKSIFSLPETTLGIIPGAGGTQRLPRLIGLQNAKKMIYFGMKLNGDQAQNINLIDEVFETQKQMDDYFMNYQNLSDQSAPIALKSAKNAIQNGLYLQLEEGLEQEKKYYKNTLVSKDRIEALQAFKEKRKPQFKGE